jgi:hypothetical protein
MKEKNGMTWVRKEVLDRVPELPSRVDFDDWEKGRGLVNLLSEKKNSKPWLHAGFYKRTKGRQALRAGSPSFAQGVAQAVWLEKPSLKSASKRKRTRSKALSAAKTRGVSLGNPRLHEARKSAIEAVKAEADRYAANVLPIILRPRRPVRKR